MITLSELKKIKSNKEQSKIQTNTSIAELLKDNALKKIILSRLRADTRNMERYIKDNEAMIRKGRRQIYQYNRDISKLNNRIKNYTSQVRQQVKKNPLKALEKMGDTVTPLEASETYRGPKGDR